MPSEPVSPLTMEEIDKIYAPEGWVASLAEGNRRYLALCEKMGQLAAAYDDMASKHGVKEIAGILAECAGNIRFTIKIIKQCALLPDASREEWS